MGYNNNLFVATPPDTLHLLCAGLMKSLTKAIVSIVHNVTTKNKAFSHSKGLFDFRRVLSKPWAVPGPLWVEEMILRRRGPGSP